MALAALTLSNDPFGVLSYMMRLAAFTSCSALPLDCGYSTDDKWCFTPHLDKNSLNASEFSCGPPSELNCSGAPLTVISDQRTEGSACALSWTKMVNANPTAESVHNSQIIMSCYTEEAPTYLLKGPLWRKGQY